MWRFPSLAFNIQEKLIKVTSLYIIYLFQPVANPKFTSHFEIAIPSFTHKTGTCSVPLAKVSTRKTQFFFARQNLTFPLCRTSCIGKASIPIPRDSWSDGKAKQTLFMSQLKPGMGCTLDGAAPDNKAVQRGNGRGGIEEGCPREKENCREKEIPRERE